MSIFFLLGFGTGIMGGKAYAFWGGCLLRDKAPHAGDLYSFQGGDFKFIMSI